MVIHNVREALPLKQGLRRDGWDYVVLELRSQRGTSIKTRIKTF